MRGSKPNQQFATVGFRAKTGRAIAVALSGTSADPRLVLRREVRLTDPDVPETAEPYHAVMELPWPEATVAVQQFIEAIERRAAHVLDELAAELQSKGFSLAAVGVVGSPDRPLEKIGNEHIRAHAAEGIAFRRVLEVAAAKRSCLWQSFSDRTIGTNASSQLQVSPTMVASMLKSLGRDAGAPWRIDERAAATAAWIVLR